MAPAVSPAAAAPARPTLRTPKPRRVPKNLAAWLEAGYHDSAIADAFGSLATLLQDSVLAVSHNVDFGVVDVSGVSALGDDVRAELTHWQGLLPAKAVRHCLL